MSCIGWRISFGPRDARHNGRHCGRTLLRLAGVRSSGAFTCNLKLQELADRPRDWEELLWRVVVLGMRETGSHFA